MIYWHFLNKYKNIKKRQQQQKKQTCCNFIANTSKSFLKNTAKQKKQLLLRHMLLSLVVETLLGLYKIVQNLWNHTRNEIRLQSYTWIHNAKKYLHIRSYKSTHYVFVFPVAKHPCTKNEDFSAKWLPSISVMLPRQNSWSKASSGWFVLWGWTPVVQCLCKVSSSYYKCLHIAVTPEQGSLHLWLQLL